MKIGRRKMLTLGGGTIAARQLLLKPVAETREI